MTTSDYDYVFSYNLFDYDFEFNYHSITEKRTLRELATLDVNYNALCIEYPEVIAPF